jgi:hypothetical protein
MNITSRLALALVLVGAGGAAWAEDSAVPMRSMTTKEDWTMIHHEKGIVTAVDVESGRLRVKNEQGDMKRFFAKKAKVDSVQGKTISLADLAIGDKVSVTSRGRNATEVIRLHRAKRR